MVKKNLQILNTEEKKKKKTLPELKTQMLLLTSLHSALEAFICCSLPWVETAGTNAATGAIQPPVHRLILTLNTKKHNLNVMASHASLCTHQSTL